MTVPLIFITVALFILIELVYFKLAGKFNITDHPNTRSSHVDVTIRGGGIIFPLSVLFYALYFKNEFHYFLAGLFLISLISFVDDIRQVNNKLRLIVHLVAVGLLFYQMSLFGLPLYLIVFAFFFTIGTINAVNFMDGINGITGGYGIITILSLYFINTNITEFTDSNLLIIVMLSLLVFNFFNFKKKAVCFAGDVGSVSLGFIIVYFILSLILKTSNFNYILLLLVYGLDVVSTIIFRIIRKERILEAHRSHFYQFLFNNRGIAQLIVSLIYLCSQLIVNLLLIFSGIQSFFVLILVLLLSGIVFVKIRFMLEGAKKLLG